MYRFLQQKPILLVSLALLPGAAIYGKAVDYLQNIGVIQYPANAQIEDRFILDFDPLSNCIFSGVYDGHSNAVVSDYISKNLTEAWKQCMKDQKGREKQQDVEKCLKQSYDEIENHLLQKMKENYESGQSIKDIGGGSCALTAVVHQNNFISIANAGDCQAVMVSQENGQIVGTNLMPIHSANLIDEQERLKKLFPDENDIVRCRRVNVCYVKGRLMPTRSFGDFHLKYKEFNNPNLLPNLNRPIPQFTGKYITHEPDVSTFKLNKQNKFLVLATDGVWDELTPQEVAEIALSIKDPKQITQKILEEVLVKSAKKVGITLEQIKRYPQGMRRNLHDDVTVVVVPLDVNYDS